MKLNEFKTTYEAEGFFMKNGYNHIFWDIIEIIRNKNKRNYKRSTDEKAKETFIQIFNNLLNQNDLHLNLKSYGVVWVLIANLIQELKNKEVSK
jgi:hypothetical protein